MPVAPPSVLPPWLAAAERDTPHPAPPTGTAPPTGARTPTGAGAASGTGTAEPVLSPGEAELRELLQRSVSGLQPASGSLETLRRAVPLRRARRRRCGGVVGALVLGVLGGLALHSLASAGGLNQGPQSGPSYQNAATASAAGRAGAGPTSNAVPPYPPSATGVGGTLPPLTGAGAPSGAASGSRSGSTAPGPSGFPASGSGTGGDGSSAAECTRAQLGGGAATVGAADADGTTYGSFQVANVSQTTCEVSLPGTVTVLAASGTSATRIAVVQHSASDPATQLPAPLATPSPVLLGPGQSYAVDFAWVPATGAGAPSCADDGPSSPTATVTATTADDGSDPTDAATAAVSDSQDVPPTTSPPPTGAPSVTLAQTPGVGGPPAVSAVLPDACAGTVYDTQPLATG